MANEYLLKVWGRNTDTIAGLRPADQIEDQALYYWFATDADREAFIDLWRSSGAMRAIADPGVDDQEENILTRHMTVALVTLRFPDGEEVSFEESFGYGYPEHAVHYMFYDGNYSCDCNRQLFAERHCNRASLEEEDLMCGDTIELVSLVVEKRPMLVAH